MRIMKSGVFSLGVLLTIATANVGAMPPDKFFQKTAPSIWRVFVYDADGIRSGQGSAVVVGKETLLTNCHVLAKAKRFVVRKDNISYEARLQHIDVERDLCQVTARNLDAPAVPVGDSDKLTVGQHVYTLGNPEGLELTLSDGLISALRQDEATGRKVIQTTAPITHGSSGGGLFDEEGRLIGITSSGYISGNLNFAIPINYLQELPARSAAALAKRSATASSALPAKMDTAQAEQAPRAAADGGTAAPRSSSKTSGYGEIGDVGKLVRVNPRARAAYEAFLAKPLPRAFALSENGGWWTSVGNRPKDPSASTDPALRAVPDCEKYHQRRCFLYAVDDAVVWNASNVIELKPAVAPPVAHRTPIPAVAPPAPPMVSTAPPEPPKEHMFAKPAPSGFASASDSNAIPFLSARAREGFVRYLTLKSPKAFAIGADGSWSFIVEDPRAMKTALERCEARGATCWLYAVDNDVVWREEPAGRVRIPQLSSR